MKGLGNFKKFYLVAALALLLVSAWSFYWLLAASGKSPSAKIDELASLISQRIDSYVLVINGAHNLLAGGATLASWQSYLDQLDTQDNYRGLSSIAYSEWIPASAKSAYEQELRQIYGDNNISIFPPVDTGDHLLVLKYVYPLTDKLKKAIGVNVAALPGDFSAVKSAIDSDLPTLSERTVFSTSGQTGFSISEPIFIKSTSIATAADRRQAFSGAVGVAMNSNDFFGEIFKNFPLGSLRIRISDPDSDGDGLLYDTNPAGKAFVPLGTRKLEIHNESWNVSYGSN